MKKGKEKGERTFCSEFNPDKKISVCLTDDDASVAVWNTSDPYYTIHMEPTEAIKMADRLIKAALKAMENNSNEEGL